MPVWTIQSNLNRGQLDPRLLGRTDIDAYYNGARVAENVRSIPQGGMEKRPGSLFIDEQLGDGRLENFSFNVEQEFVLVFTDSQMRVYKDDVLQTTVATPWSLDKIREFDYIQSADVGIVTHPDEAPQQIVRTNDTTWSVSPISLLNIPQFDFDDGLSPTPTSEIQTLRFNNYADGDTFTLSLEGIQTDDITYQAADTSDTAAQIQDALQRLPNTGSTGINVVFTSGTTYTVTFAGSSAKDWKLLTGRVVTGTGDLTDNSITVTRTQTGSPRTEDVWSLTRGYPRTCTFHEGRLYFGGSLSRPATIWGSRVGQFFDFDKGQSRDDESLEFTLDTDQVNVIEAIFSNRSLQIFTSGQEFFVRDSPVTPANVAAIAQSNLGSKRVRPVTLDGVTLFIQRSGKSVNQFLFINELQSNQASSISTLAADLVNDPVKMSVFKGSGTVDANYVYILGSDGNITVFNTLIAENVQGFTNWTAPENTSVKSIAVVDSKLYVLIETIIQESTVYYLLKEDQSLNTDAAATQAGPTDTITGLDHLEGETVEVKGDGAFLGEFVVSGGQVTIDRDADFIEAGTAFRPTIQTMPLNVDLGQGPDQFAKKKIQRIALQLFESNGVVVNNQRIADKTIGLNQFDPPTPQTGPVRIYVLGWSLDASVTITQTTPMPMTVLSIGIEVAT